MRMFVLIVAIAMMTAAPSGVVLSSASAQSLTATAPNNTPLIFGLDAEQTSRALGVPLTYVRGRRGEELYVAYANVKGAALSDRNDGLYLQFRRGRLQGWKGDWIANRPCCW